MNRNTGALRQDQGCGFTLIEIMIVVSIIGILGLMIIPKLLKIRDTSNLNVARSDLEMLSAAIEQLAIDTEKWPGGMPYGDRGTFPEVWDLAGPTAGLVSNDGRFTNWAGPYMKVVPHDPWGHDYFLDNDYTIGGTGATVVVVGSFGPNGVGPNLYDSDDIYSVLLR